MDRINSIFDTEFSIVKCIQYLSLYASYELTLPNNLDQVAIALKSYATSLDSIYNKLLSVNYSLRDTLDNVLLQINYAIGVVAYRLIKLPPEDPRVSSFKQKLNNKGLFVDINFFQEVTAKNKEVLSSLLALTNDSGAKQI